MKHLIRNKDVVLEKLNDLAYKVSLRTKTGLLKKIFYIEEGVRTKPFDVEQKNEEVVPAITEYDLTINLSATYEDSLYNSISINDAHVFDSEKSTYETKVNDGDSVTIEAPVTYTPMAGGPGASDWIRSIGVNGSTYQSDSEKVEIQITGDTVITIVYSSF